jgi:D-sedoheptulose 7-phosphate isomerase
MQLINGNWVRPSTAEEPLTVEAYFQSLKQLIPRLPYEGIDGIVAAILRAFDEQRTVFVFGNGGSAASASHLMCDMNKTVIEPSGPHRVRVMALTDNIPLMTAWANDAGYESVFSEQLRNFVQPRDVAFAISGSGDSPNVLAALRLARAAGASTLGLAGYKGGQMKPLCDICAVVPCENMQMVEDMHHAILHSMVAAVREHIRSGNRQIRAAAAGRSLK